MRIFLFLLLFSVLSGCNTVQIAKEFAKATKSIKTSVENIVKDEEEVAAISEKVLNDKEKPKNIIADEVDLNIKNERKIVEEEKKQEEIAVKEQKKVVRVNFLGKTISEIKYNLGNESLLRVDGNTDTARFDNHFCKIFLFFNNSEKNPKVQYFEIRNNLGELIQTKKQVEICYKEFGLT